MNARIVYAGGAVLCYINTINLFSTGHWIGATVSLVFGMLLAFLSNS